MAPSRIAARAAATCALCAAALALAGCGDSAAPAKAELPPPVVTVAAPVERTLTRYELAKGRTAPLEQVDIRARVSGYLKAIDFQPGREVTRGAPLFKIDPEPFEADLAKAKAYREVSEADLKTAEAESLRAEAHRGTAKKTYDREEDSFKRGAGAEQARDIAKGVYDEADASVLAAKAKIKLATAKIDESKAAVRSAELNLGYCTITAPITGIVGDQLVTVGNLVTGGIGATTLLTTIVAVDKMDVAFDVDENTLQRIQKAVRDGKIKAPAPGEIPAEAGLSVHGTDYPLKGNINFADNKVDAKTGTIRMKARFDNPKPAAGPRLLAAGMYARVRVPVGEPARAVLVPESALGSDQGIAFLYVVDADNKAARLDAVIGMQDGDMRVVESVELPGSGKPRPLSPSDRVIVSGAQRVRPGMTVDAKPAGK